MRLDSARSIELVKNCQIIEYHPCRQVRQGFFVGSPVFNLGWVENKFSKVSHQTSAEDISN
ncbi:MAG: hypothetical protein AAFO95_06210 [Cyanobacteria bacterium J06600_6]